ncbi:MAG: GFA family protein [Hyphomicrobiales bacterium]
MGQDERTGRCLCGAVTFKAVPGGAHTAACHCSMCRKWCSGPYLLINCGKAVEFEGEENITVYRSSDWGERGFCAKCGSNLFWRLADGGQYGIAAGAFDSDEGWTMKREIFIDEKPDWYDFGNDTEKMTGPEVIALFTEGSGAET